MTEKSISGVKVLAVSSAAPEYVLTSGGFAELYGAKEVERISQGTGIRSIREGKSLRTSDLILAACRRIFEQGIAQIAEIDGIVIVTQTPDNWSPGISFFVQKELGLSQNCIALDISAGCSGYITALIQGSALISSGVCKKVLVCTGDVTTKLLDDNDRHLRMIFGDAASATLLEAGSDAFKFISKVDGNGGPEVLGAKIDYRDHGPNIIYNLHMDGTDVMNFVLSKIPTIINELFTSTGITIETLDLLVLHQANEFMVKYLRRMMGVPPDKVPIDVDGIGNTSSTSIPLLLSRHSAIGTEHAKNVFLCGFGAGLSWGAMKVDLSHTVALPPVFVSSPKKPSYKLGSEGVFN